mmetsp:Transcript_73020/g.89570  ORF Transcript_73020/g.89570 Transcript_73020/m.89570 type:complete len:282 (-) Transcript_73020:147-992(-)
MADQPTTQSKAFKLESIYFLKVKIIKGKDLIACDMNGKSDPYCIVTASDRSYKTKVIEKTLNPEWNESTSFSFLKKVDIITFKLFDQDKKLLGKDDPMGDCTLDVSQYYGENHGGFFNWIKLENVKKGSIEVSVEGRLVKPIELEERIKKLSQLKAENDQKLAELKRQETEQKRINDDETNKNNKFNNDKTELETKLNELTTQRDDAESKNRELTNNVNSIKGDIKRIETETEENQSNIQDKKTETEALKTKMTNIRSERDGLLQDLDDLRNEAIKYDKSG